MARLTRLYVPDQPQHIILRALSQQPAFVDEQDYQHYIDCLRDAARDNQLLVHAWTLMPGAVQLLASPATESSLPKTMQAVGRRYVAAFNRRHGRRGTLWEGRFRATVIDPNQYFLLASRLVELAPVHSNLVAAPGEYRWSSYQHHVGLLTDPLISDHPRYWGLGNTPFERQRAYRELCDQPHDEAEANRLIQATNKGWVFGSDSFRAMAAQSANRRISPLRRGRPRRAVPADKAACMMPAPSTPVDAATT